MKKAYILFWTIFLILLISLWMSLSLNISNYTPKIIQDSYYFLQAQILSQNAIEFSKYFLYKAKEENKECLNDIHFNYAKALIKIKYFYPLSECINFKFSHFNKDANLSKDGIIIAHISIALNSNKNVNDEIILTKDIILYPKENFWNIKN
ncbi:hypothetical protein [Campylobacter hepaticus]|uniref:Periplasmic protein n=1 Tax=Campylobacter hepaticus TaxID=1813019 RepID=A0A6A7JRI7_9BACT|nr:hypothetical protein [Campylobacter hepaticus]MPV90995.1 hypothetical protein [Campylobacter hepaticus]